jgi:Mrp family chromosome partitioning ATPase/predicted Fe-Mo cluster-binding NifX family protein
MTKQNSGNCSAQGSDSNALPTLEAIMEKQQIQERMSLIKHKILIMSGKGGVGKSTVAVNLAVSLAMRGKSVGLLDVDIHGPSIPKLLGIHNQKPSYSDGVIQPIGYPIDGKTIHVMSIGFFLESQDDAIIWRGPLKMGAIKQFLKDSSWGNLDYLIIDSPPGTGDEPLAVRQLINGLEGAIIVTTPQELALVDVRKSVNFCRHVQLPVLGVIENMSGLTCPHCGGQIDVFSSGGGEIMADNMHVPFLGSIPIDPDIVKSGDEERPYMYFYSKTGTAQKFDEIVERLIGQKSPAVSIPQGKREVEKPPTSSNKEVIMKFAVPTYQRKLCTHFGHCEAFALIDADVNGIILNETYETPPPHEPGLLPEWLSLKGVNCVIAGGMGSRAQQLFVQKGVKVVTGAEGEYPREVVEQYLKGTLQTGANACDH